MRGKAHGPQAAFDPGENVFEVHTGRVTEHAQECTRENYLDRYGNNTLNVILGAADHKEVLP
jgi:hypothetical protein